MYQQAIAQYLQQNHHTTLRPKAVLFDMDGVLYNSMVNHTAAWYQAISELGITCNRDEFYLYEGRTGLSTINMLFNRAFGKDATEDERHRIYQHKTELFNALPTAEVMAGAHELLQQVKALGLTVVLVTGSGQSTLIDRLNTQFPHIFSPHLMVTALDVKYGKPHPEPYLMGLEKAGVKPNEAIVVENAPLGVEAAHAAGIFTVAVNTGPLAPQVLSDAGSNLLYNSVEELNENFNQLYQTLLQASI